MDKDLIDKGLRPWASTDERISALQEAGIKLEIIARAVGASISSVRRWESGSSPNAVSFDRLDCLRSAMGTLIRTKGFEPEAASEWLQTPRESNPNITPIDFLPGQPLHFFDTVAALPDVESSSTEQTVADRHENIIQFRPRT